MIQQIAQATVDLEGMKPIGHFVFVQPVKSEKVGRIHLPHNHNQWGNKATRFGRVVGLGDDVELGISEGDLVVFDYMTSGRQQPMGGGDEIFKLNAEVGKDCEVLAVVDE